MTDRRLVRAIFGVLALPGALLALPLAAVALGQMVTGQVVLPSWVIPASIALLTGLFARPLWRTARALLGAGFARVQPRVADVWLQQEPSVPSGQAVVFHLLRVPAAEVARVSVQTVGDYLYMRCYERRAGIRFGEGLYALEAWAGRSTVARRGVSVMAASLRSEVATMTNWRLWPLLTADPDRLRALAAVVGVSRPASRGGTGWTIVQDASQMLRDRSPREVVGLAHACDVAVAEGALPPGTSLHAVEAWTTGRPDVPSWLLVLAGFSPGERVPASAQVSDLVGLAALRGHRVHPLAA